MNTSGKIGLVVGRFQPFHLGHLYLIREALKQADKIIIAVGSSNVQNEENPMSYETRVAMLEKVIEQEKIGDRVIKIVPSPDDTSDDVWLEELLKNVGKFDFEAGNNDWTNGILEKKGYKVLQTPYLKRDIYQGKVIRELFKTGGKWEERVPAYLVEFVKKELSK